MNATTLATIEIAQGRLAGLSKEGIQRFTAIPYAKPLTGTLRWRAPEPAEPWAGVRDATRFGAISPQVPTQLEVLMGSTLGEQSEDCLNLNVYTRACDDAKRPVMVWIHGGAFVIGAGSQGIYNAKHLAARGVVVVTINYRLGALGFLNLFDATDGKLAGSGAEGLADQILALHWVKANIAGFGGDPGNVTIFGESAGGMSVSALLASPPAKGLFHKAIAQSGAAHIGYEREKAARVARAMLDELGLSPGDAHRVLDMPHAAIVKAQIALLAASRDGRDSRRLGGLPFQPTIDASILPAEPIVGIRAGSAKDIPLLTGTTRDEWKLFTAANPALRLMSGKTLGERIKRFAGEDRAGEMLAAYGEGSVFERFNALMTDKNFMVPATRLLEAQSAYAPVYGYRFDWASKLLGGIMGSCHALELGFVFGTHGEKLAAAFFGKGEAAEALSCAMQESWVQFAKTGNPATDTTGDWPRYNMQSRGITIFGDGAPHIAHAPNEARRKSWDHVAEKRLGP
ncbi:MAG: carboxylesterase/lipase family protein [Proteobacteria bacterium]|nr:carboxylesterase/lipase family protein [Pseudomonadota bacterium]